MGCKTKPRCQGVVFNTKAEVDYTYVQVLFEDDYDIHIHIYIYIFNCYTIYPGSISIVSPIAALVAFQDLAHSCAAG